MLPPPRRGHDFEVVPCSPESQTRWHSAIVRGVGGSMNDRARERFFAWCEHHCQAPMVLLQPRKLTGAEVVEALWELNEDFRPHFAAFVSLPYNPAFESRADDAIEAYLADGQWGPTSVETWRVLLERQCQAILVAEINDREGNSVMSAPETLPREALKGAAMLWMLHSMALPFAPSVRA